LLRGYRVQMKDIDIVGIETTEARINSLFHGFARGDEPCLFPEPRR
jgi:hypothetical protein